MVRRAIAVAALLLIESTRIESSSSIVKSIHQNENGLFDKLERRRRMEELAVNKPTLLHDHRSLGSADKQENCDAAFLSCLPNVKCLDCFSSLQTEEVDWASVSTGTTCVDVVQFLTDGGHCLSLNKDKVATAVFCNTFKSCVVWEEDEIDDNDYENHEHFVNCTALTECNWPGMHPSFIADGVCHDNLHGCYNTAICGYDGGDCCEDTCDGDYLYVECGHDGFACRDPKSRKCNSALTTKCPGGSSKGDVPDPSSVTCDEKEQKYRITMYDSFGDGWDTTEMRIAPSSNKSKPKFSGGLKEGAQGTEFVCLSKSPACYNVDLSGGTWGVEVSWDIKSMNEGAPSVAAGGAPMNCDFSVGGAVCTTTCTGKPNEDPTDDPTYKTFKDLYTCISEKCVIQLGACEADPVCEQCFGENAPDYCFNVDTFNAIIDCTMCSCTDRKETSYCTEKGSKPSKPSDHENVAPKKCSPAETIMGSNAVISFSKCTDFDQVGMMVTEFNNDNFGQLDTFEACCHAFKDETNHGGHTALACMKILNNAMTNPTSNDDHPDAPEEAIKALATFLYNDAASFCECTRQASSDCPLCPSFMQFKTLLYESLDACQSLDEIDCDAWNEFYMPCQKNLADQFKVADFKKKGQCEYTKLGCGSAGPFPAFRRLDCDKELPQEAWDFYLDYSQNCLEGSDGIPPSVDPSSPVAPTPTAAKPTDAVPTPAVAPIVKPTKPTAKGDGPTPRPYIPADDSSSPADAQPTSQTKKKKSHFFRNFLLLCLMGGGGYFYYKRRSDAFNFIRYRRARTFDYDNGAGENHMYSSLNNSTTFEPPSLPPTPASMGPMGNYNPMENFNPMSNMGMQMT